MSTIMLPKHALDFFLNVTIRRFNIPYTIIQKEHLNVILCHWGFQEGTYHLWFCSFEPTRPREGSVVSKDVSKPAIQIPFQLNVLLNMSLGAPQYLLILDNNFHM